MPIEDILKQKKPDNLARHLYASIQTGMQIYKPFMEDSSLTHSGPRTPYGGVISCSESFTAAIRRATTVSLESSMPPYGVKKIRVLFPSAAIRSEWKRPFLLAICALIVTSL